MRHPLPKVEPHWRRGVPPEPGYYWMIRRFGTGRQRHETLGIALVIYDPHHYIVERRDPPLPHVRSLVLMHGTMQQVGESWGTMACSASDKSEWEYWSAPLQPPLHSQPLFRAHPKLPGPPKAPSARVVAEKKASEEQAGRERAVKDAEEWAERRRVWEDAIKSKSTLYWCEGCEEFREPDELGTERECSRDSCGERFFVESGGDRNCTSCNNPFTRVEEEHACADCETAENVQMVLDKGQVIHDVIAEEDDRRAGKGEREKGSASGKQPHAPVDRGAVQVPQRRRARSDPFGA